MRLRFAKMYPYVPLRGCNKYKKKIILIVVIILIFNVTSLLDKMLVAVGGAGTWHPDYCHQP